jgi:translocation and assembly module TamB
VKWVRYTLIGLAALLLLVVGAVIWILNSEWGAQWALARAESALAGKLAVGGSQGALSGPLLLRDVRYHDPETGVFFDAREVSVDIALRELLIPRVHVVSLRASGVRVDKREGTRPPPPEEEPSPTLDPPLDILVDQVVLQDAVVHNNGEQILQITKAEAAASWTRAGINVRQFDLASPDGEIHLLAHVDKDQVYIGEADGRFRWRVGDRSYAGTLRGEGKGEQATVHLDLTAPVVARAEATVRQTESLPWTLKLDVPRFQAAQLLEDTKLQHLGAQIAGEGDLNSGRLAGNVLVNDDRIDVQQLRFARTPEEISLEPLQVLVRTARAELVARYGLEQKVVRIQRLTIEEPVGRLTTEGTVRLEPHLAWQLKAAAQEFNPGELAKEWQGSLSFDLDTEGEVLEKGPRARVQLSDLRGRLRDRRVSGDGDLTLEPGMALVGELQVRSGRSSVRVQGESKERMDVTTVINIASLDDWLPDAKGRIDGRVRARGVWPEISLDGRITANGLSMQDAKVQQAVLVANISNLQARAGNASFDASEITVGDGSWSRLSVRANGDPDGHTLTIDATGEPVAGQLVVSGALKGEEWNGTLDALQLNVVRAGRFDLQEPVPLRFADGAASIGNACFTGRRELYLCFSGERAADGALQAKYEIRDLPLRYLAALAELDQSLQVRGRIEGRGDIRRDAEGALFGNASITSQSGSLASTEAGNGDQEILISYKDLSIQALLVGDAGAVTVGAVLNDSAGITGELRAGALRSDAPTLDGNARVELPTLAPVAVFAPQLSNVTGRMEAEARIAGNTVEPQIEARVLLSGFGTDFPELGIQLRDGNIEATRSVDGVLRLEGQVSSGEGQIRVTGGQESEDLMRFEVTGENFVVANIPAAQMRISPKLGIERTSERLQINGTVTVPSAHVDVQKLPARQATAVGASADVVVIDDPPAQKSAARKTPVFADVTVVLGEKVRLQGFGLDAQVAGQLVVREQPGTETVGSGQLRVTGTYKAYGQDLTIERGSLSFAGTPLNNPSLDIAAFRKIEEENVRAGLLISGTAQSPQLVVTSEPPMQEAEALSYLVTGRPLNAVGSAETDLMQSAARSLGTAAGNLLARNVGRRLGVDQLGIEKSEALGDSAFTVGEYLSPRLFLSYGVGLFTPGEVLTLRYRIAEALELEASSAPNETRTSLQWRAER